VMSLPCLSDEARGTEIFGHETLLSRRFATEDLAAVC